MIAQIDDEDAPVQAQAPGCPLATEFAAMTLPINRTYRELTDLDLIEVSVVTHPMQPLARVLAIETTQ